MRLILLLVGNVSELIMEDAEGKANASGNAIRVGRGGGPTIRRTLLGNISRWLKCHAFQYGK